MFFPISTDAPVYYWPFATVGLIVLNALIFVCMILGLIDPTEGWVLTHGDGFHANQWLTSMFTHADVGHLLGNMIFLWVFGLVVEGKLGWKKFLACYLGVGVSANVFEQYAMLDTGNYGGSVGASTAIYGILAIACVWAPLNHVRVVLWLMTPFLQFEMTIGKLTLVYVIINSLGLVLRNGAMSSEWLHVVGVLFGFPIGVFLLRANVVDCEGWDLFNLGESEFTPIRDQKRKLDEEQNEQMDLIHVPVDREQEMLGDTAYDVSIEISQLLKKGDVSTAKRMYEIFSSKSKGVELRLKPDDLLALIKAMHQREQWAKSAPLMDKFIHLAPDRADAMRVKLAQICVVELGRPGRAIDLLRGADPEKLTTQQHSLADKIAMRAQAMQAEGHIELDDEGW